MKNTSLCVLLLSLSLAPLNAARAAEVPSTPMQSQGVPPGAAKKSGEPARGKYCPNGWIQVWYCTEWLSDEECKLWEYRWECR
jgi:hypothetical protein